MSAWLATLLPNRFLDRDRYVAALT